MLISHAWVATLLAKGERQKSVCRGPVKPDLQAQCSCCALLRAGTLTLNELTINNDAIYALGGYSNDEARPALAPACMHAGSGLSYAGEGLSSCSARPEALKAPAD
jgi:hypothetical protein